MTASLNLFAVLHQYENLSDISKKNSCFSSYTNSRTSVDSIAPKRQNLSTKEKPESAYYADLHEFKKRISSLKLPDDWQISDKQNHIFQKSNSYEISRIDIYVGEDLEFIIRVFSWSIPLDHEIYTKYKKTMKNITLSNLIKVMSYYICSGIKDEQAKKQQPFVIQYQKLLIFLEIPLFHFIKSISTIQFHVCF